MYYSSGNYEAFARPKKPEGVDHKSAYIIGSGLGALAAACYLVRDGQMKGEMIHVLEKDPDAKLTLVGDGSLHDELQQQVLEMGLKNVFFTGRVDNSRIYRLLDQADIMVSAPTIDNMPVSLLEAMNAGLLVISSNVGGVPYMVRDMETGLLFPSDDHVALAQRMLWALDNQERSMTIIDSAHTEVIKYNWKSIRSKIISIYSE